MAKPTFSTSEAIRFGWKIMASNFVFFVVLLVILLAVQLALGPSELVPTLQDYLGKTTWPSNLGSGIVSWLVSLLIAFGLIKMNLLLAAGKSVTWQEILATYPVFLNYLALMILYALIVLGGLLLLVIPGLVWAIRFYFGRYLVVDKALGPVTALKESFALTKGKTFDLLGLFVVVAAFNLFGAIPLGLGLLATIPTSWVAQAYVYRRLTGQG